MRNECDGDRAGRGLGGLYECFRAHWHADHSGVFPVPDRDSTRWRSPGKRLASGVHLCQHDARGCGWSCRDIRVGVPLRSGVAVSQSPRTDPGIRGTADRGGDRQPGGVRDPDDHASRHRAALWPFHQGVWRTAPPCPPWIEGTNMHAGSRRRAVSVAVTSRPRRGSAVRWRSRRGSPGLRRSRGLRGGLSWPRVRPWPGCRAGIRCGLPRAGR